MERRPAASVPGDLLLPLKLLPDGEGPPVGGRIPCALPPVSGPQGDLLRERNDPRMFELFATIMLAALPTICPDGGLNSLLLLAFGGEDPCRLPAGQGELARLRCKLPPLRLPPLGDMRLGRPCKLPPVNDILTGDLLPLLLVPCKLPPRAPGDRPRSVPGEL